MIDNQVGPAALSGPCVPHEEPYGLPGLFHAQAEATPVAIACEDCERSLTYRRLDLLSDATAQELDQVVTAPGPVLLLLRRGVDALVAMLGVLKSGRSYVPVDPDEPAPRLAAIVSAACPAAVLIGEGEDSPVTGLPALTVPRSGGRPRPLPPVTPDQPVYTMFTSGSTGEPKGVVLGSGALANRLLWMQREYGLEPADRVLQKTPYTFDVSGWELFWPLLAGARCVFAPPGKHREPAALAALIAEREITVCHFVPSMLAEFLRVPAAAETRTLRHVFCSGEVLPGQLARRFIATLPARLHNLYGPTEAAIDVTYWPVPSDLAEGDEVLIGAPIDNTRLYVLDSVRHPVEPGSVGELWIGGEPVARGYAGRPDLTEAAFAMIGDDRCYRTGDLVCQTAGGMRYLGRADDQVKVGGVRIEPTEVERVLTAHSGIRQAVVTKVEGGDGAELVAILIGTRDAADTELRRHVAARLPSAFVPSTFHWLDEMPLTPSGKADRRRVRELAQARRAARPVPDGTDELGAAWLEAIGRPEGPPDENAGFLAVGGTSLAAVRLAATALEHCQVVVPLTLLLDADGSLADLRAYIATAPRVEQKELEETGRPDESGSPLAPEQRRLWVLSRLYPDSPAYNVTIVLRLSGEVAPDTLAESLALTAARHDALRARVVEDDEGRPRLHFVQEARLTLETERTEQPLDDARVMSFARDASARVVPEDRPPLVRARLLTSTAVPRSCLVLVFNHLIGDQHATDLFVRQTAEAYTALVQGTQPPVVRAPRYADYARRADAGRNHQVWADDLAYWRERLTGAPPEITLPFGRHRSGTPHSLQGQAATIALDGDLRRRLEACLRETRVTKAGFFLAVFGAVLAAWSGQDDLVVGVPSSRRRFSADQDLIGFLVDTLPIRLQIGGCTWFTDLLAHARSRYTEALDHAAPTFDALVADLGLVRHPHRNPIFQVWLNDLTGGGETGGFAGLDTEFLLPPVHSSLFDLGLYLNDVDGTLILQLVSAADLYQEWVGRELLEQCVSVIRQVVTDPSVALAALDLVTAPRPAVDRMAEAGARRDVGDLFAAAVARCPHALAIVAPGRTFTYQEVESETAEAAERLRDQGVGPGDMVEIRATRSAGLPIALLACWRVGASAGLVDAGLPAERLAECGRLLDAMAVLFTADGGINARPSGTPDGGKDLSHVLFTSGTTGGPAAVRVPHGPIRDFVQWYAKAYDITPADRFAALSGPAHDPALRDVLVPLCTGASLRVPPTDRLANPADLLAWLAEAGVTILHTTPAQIELLLAADADGVSSDLSALRLVVVGGAVLTHGLLRRMGQLFGCRIVNAYGTTETPQIVACADAVDDGAPDEAEVAIGGAVAGHEVTVRMPAGQLAGVGQRGEIVVRGRNLAEGYAGGYRQGAFADAPEAGVRIFHTGDLARFDRDGRIHVAGRADRQVSVNGHRLQLEEIEAAARSHPAIRQALAALTNTDLGPVLAIQVTIRRGHEFQRSALEEHLRARLPAHAVPASIVVLDALGLGATQKVEMRPVTQETLRRATRRPGGGDGLIDLIGGELTRLLGRSIGAEENFFEAGLNSITLLQLHVLITKKLRRAFPATALFAHPNLGALARYLGDGEGGKGRVRTRDRAALADRARRSGYARRELRHQLRDGGDDNPRV